MQIELETQRTRAKCARQLDSCTAGCSVARVSWMAHRDDTIGSAKVLVSILVNWRVGARWDLAQASRQIRAVVGSDYAAQRSAVLVTVMTA